MAQATRRCSTAAGQAYGVDPYLLGAIWGIETDYGAVLGNTKLHPADHPVAGDAGASAARPARRRRGRSDRGAAAGAARAARRAPAGRLLGRRHRAPAGQSDQCHRAWHGRRWRRPHRPPQFAGRCAGDAARNSCAASATSRASTGALRSSVPDGFDYLLATRDQLRPVSFFAERGVTRVRRRGLRRTSIRRCSSTSPTGANGPKFLMTQNYLVLKGYNFSDSYAHGGRPYDRPAEGRAASSCTAWPRDTKFPNLAQRKAIQQALIDLGLYEGAGRWPHRAGQPGGLCEVPGEQGRGGRRLHHPRTATKSLAAATR